MIVAHFVATGGWFFHVVDDVMLPPSPHTSTLRALHDQDQFSQTRKVADSTSLLARPVVLNRYSVRSLSPPELNVPTFAGPEELKYEVFG